jgi:hypothetical protein
VSIDKNIHSNYSNFILENGLKGAQIPGTPKPPWLNNAPTI